MPPEGQSNIENGNRGRNPREILRKVIYEINKIQMTNFQISQYPRYSTRE